MKSVEEKKLPPFQEFEKEIDYNFKNKKLLMEALTHSSYANEGKKHLPNNERLEFLGDSVLSVIVAEHLFLILNIFRKGSLQDSELLSSVNRPFLSSQKRSDWVTLSFLEKEKKIQVDVSDHLLCQMLLKR